MTKETHQYRPDVYSSNGAINAPRCCGWKMEGDGECPEGCCDDWKCLTCGKRLRTEAPD